MLNILGKLLQAKSDVEAGVVPKVTISLDLNDPRAERLSKLAKKLMLPTTKIHTSGLITNTGMVIPGRASEFIEMLRKEIGDDIMNELAGDLDAQIVAKQISDSETLVSDIANDATAVSSLTTALIKDPETRHNLNSDQRELFGRISGNLE